MHARFATRLALACAMAIFCLSQVSCSMGGGLRVHYFDKEALDRMPCYVVKGVFVTVESLQEVSAEKARSYADLALNKLDYYLREDSLSDYIQVDKSSPIKLDFVDFKDFSNELEYLPPNSDKDCLGTAIVYMKLHKYNKDQGDETSLKLLFYENRQSKPALEISHSTNNQIVLIEYIEPDHYKSIETVVKGVVTGARRTFLNKL